MIKPCQKKWLSIKRETGNDAPFIELSPFYFGMGGGIPSAADK
jgi:hypothetical protein